MQELLWRFKGKVIESYEEIRRKVVEENKTELELELAKEEIKELQKKVKIMEKEVEECKKKCMNESIEKGGKLHQKDRECSHIEYVKYEMCTRVINHMH